MASEFFGRQRECRFYTAGCGNKMAVSVTGPRPVNEFGSPVIPGRPTSCTIAFWGTLVLRILTVDHTFNHSADIIRHKQDLACQIHQ